MRVAVRGGVAACLPSRGGAAAWQTQPLTPASGSEREARSGAAGAEHRHCQCLCTVGTLSVYAQLTLSVSVLVGTLSVCAQLTAQALEHAGARKQAAAPQHGARRSSAARGCFEFKTLRLTYAPLTGFNSPVWVTSIKRHLG